MEIPAWLFITFWAVISITFLHLGFHAIEKTELSNSVSSVVMFLFKHSLVVSSCFSSSYALKFRAQSRYAVRSNFLLLVYVFFSIVFRRTVEGILIWHVVKTIFTWLFYLIIKLHFFYEMILQIPSWLVLFIFRCILQILLAIGLIIVVLVLCNVSLLAILSFMFVFATYMFAYVVGILFELITSYAFAWFFSATEFCWILILYFVGICTGLLLSVSFVLFLYEFLLHCKSNFSELKTRSSILLMLEISLFFVSREKRNFSPVLALSISHFVCVLGLEFSRGLRYYTAISDGESFEGWVPIAMSVVVVKMRVILSMLNEHKLKKFIEFAVGTVGAVLFQNFFKITSFNEVAAFLYLAVMWLGNLVLVGFSGDFGVFNFLLANVVVGCTVGEFGLHGVTWVALGAAFVLYGLRLKLETLTMVYEEGQRIQLSFCGDDDSRAEL